MEEEECQMQPARLETDSRIEELKTKIARFENTIATNKKWIVESKMTIRRTRILLRKVYGTLMTVLQQIEHRIEKEVDELQEDIWHRKNVLARTKKIKEGDDDKIQND